MKTFTIRYELNIDLTENELYPDGTDGVGEVTPKKVAALIQSSGGMQRVINDWYLYPEGVLTVTEKKS